VPKKNNKIKKEIKEVVKKKKRKVYFGMEVQDAIVRYNDTDNIALKNKIYSEEIHAAFDKLCENIINTFKFEYFDDVFVDVKTEVVSFLVLNMHKYDHTKGSKAFSYFSVVAKNYLILHNNANYKRYKTHTGTDSLVNRGAPVKRTEYFNEFTDLMIEYFEDNINTMFKTKRDIDVAYAIVELMKQREDIENFNKKALYVLIREMTNIDTSYITKVVNVFKRHYKKLVNEFDSSGTISKNKNKFF
tara:strand:+ start:944 stop:1678 length:735 start_codon:yes stop_codon:yes gene_type:complete